MNTHSPTPAPLSAKELKRVFFSLRGTDAPEMWLERLETTLTARDETIAGLTRERDALLSFSDRVRCTTFGNDLPRLQRILSDYMKDANALCEGSHVWALGGYVKTSDLIARAEAAESRLKRLEGALNIAAAQFRSYARSHADKKTVDGDAKSATNERFAKVCEAALASDPATTEPRT